MIIRFVVETYFAIEVRIMCTIDVVRDTFPFGGSVQLQLGMTGGVCVRLIEVPFNKDVQSAGTIIQGGALFAFCRVSYSLRRHWHLNLARACGWYVAG